MSALRMPRPSDVVKDFAMLWDKGKCRTWAREDRSSYMVEITDDDMLYNGARAVADKLRAKRLEFRPRRAFKLRHRPGLRYRMRRRVKL